MVTTAQAQDISAVAALAWTWMSLAGENRPAAQASVLSMFQQQYNARIASLRAGQAEIGQIPYPIERLTTDGRYGRNTGKAVANASYLAGGREVTAWLPSLPPAYDDNMFQMIFDEITRAYPTSGTTMVGRYMWTMIRNIIGVADAQAGQIAINSLYRSTAANTSSWTIDPAAVAAATASKAGVQPPPVAGSDSVNVDGAWEVTERDFSTEPALVVGRTQRRTRSLALLGVLAIAGIGIVVASAYKGSR